MTDGYADGGGHERGGVVDAVANVERAGFGCFSADDDDFFFGRLLGVNFGDAEFVC